MKTSTIEVGEEVKEKFSNDTIETINKETGNKLKKKHNL